MLWNSTDPSKIPDSCILDAPISILFLAALVVFLDRSEFLVDAGDEEHGVSVHFVTEELDGGPVILQAKVPVFEQDTAEDLASRVHQQEHRIYPLVVKWLCQGRLSMRNEQAILDEHVLPQSGYASEE